MNIIVSETHGMIEVRVYMEDEFKFSSGLMGRDDAVTLLDALAEGVEALEMAIFQGSGE
jgi:hypothetical protein